MQKVVGKRQIKAAVLALAVIYIIIAAGITGTVWADDAETKFTIAIIPDTQNEVTTTDQIQQNWFKNRAQWLAVNKDLLNLKFVLHTGDMMNYPTWEVVVQNKYTQLTIASEGMAELDNAGIPYLIALGNHDTAATQQGGSAWEDNPWGENTNTRQRKTYLYNEYFPTSRFPGIVQFEAGKSENAYRTFEAGGKKWLAMVIEFCPRASVVEWAKTVAAEHPDHNVMIATHSYLNGNGSISTSNAGYGDTSPQYMFDNLVKLYPNIKFVFSGHVGGPNYRQDTGVNGNKIVSLLGGHLPGATNHVQLLEIDTAADTAQHRIYGPINSTNVHSGWTFYEMGYVGYDPNATPTPYPNQNAFLNPGFEDVNVSIATVSTGVTATRDTERSHSGEASLKVVKTGEPQGWPWVEIDMNKPKINWEIGAEYGWSFWAYSPDNTDWRIAARVRWANPEKTADTDFYQVPDITVGNGRNWVQSAGTFTMPETAVSSGDQKRIKVYVNANNIDNATFYLDDLYFCKLTGPTEIVTSSPADGVEVPGRSVDRVEVTFTYPVKPGTLVPGSTVLATGATISQIELSEGSHTAIIHFAQPVSKGDVSISFTGDIEDLFGRAYTPGEISFSVDIDKPAPTPTPTPAPTPTPTPKVMQNAIPDPGFETIAMAEDVVIKKEPASVTVAKSTEVSHRGAASLKMTVGETAAFPYFEIKFKEGAITWLPGKEYGFSYWAYSPSSTEITLNNRFRHNLNKESDTKDFAQAPFTIKVGGGRDWVNYSGTVKLVDDPAISPNSATYGSSKSYIQSSGISNVEVYYDDMYFYQLDGPPAVAYSQPAAGSMVSGPVSSVDITFTYPIRPSTLTPANVTVTGAQLSQIELEEGSHTATIHFAQPVSEGNVTINLSSNIKDLFDRLMVPKTFSFTVGAPEPEQGYDYTAFKFMDGAEEINALRANTTIKAVVENLQNNTGSGKDIMLVVALYKNGRIVGIGKNAVNLDNGETVPALEAEIGVGNLADGDYTLKAFLWEGLTALKPVSTILTIGEAG